MDRRESLMVTAAFAVAGCAMTLAAAVDFRRPEILPCPQEMTYEAKTEVRLDASTVVEVRCPDPMAVKWVADHLRTWFSVAPKIEHVRSSDVAEDEGYRLEAKSGSLTIEANALAGVRLALFTLRQVAERDSAGIETVGFRMPAFAVRDSPVLKFRGMHLCWLPEQSAELIEREIRTAAAFKFNCVVLEPWGVYRSERYPWFGWPDGPLNRTTLRRLVDVSRDLGVTLVPQLNVFGHATAARSCVGKHAVLDFGPKYQPLFEPAGDTGSGWNWCLSNPAAIETLRNLVAEMHSAFGSPPYFHIGCDEADEPTCASCRAVPYSELVSRHIAGICELLKARGARAMMWHDMLLRRNDSRWKGFYANGSGETAKLPQLLPKSVIICDWYYGKAVGGGLADGCGRSRAGAYPTLDYFAKECGFDTLTCPWDEPDGIRSQAKYAADAGLFGVLETTWNHYGGERFMKVFQISSCAAWGRGERVSAAVFATAWRQAGWDMKSKSYRETGWFDTQFTRDIMVR